jgi:stromal membrane-associated protein
MIGVCWVTDRWMDRCSGIHRGMGTHISKVKSVDLDSWTDEQLQSVVKWGNSRANK